MTLNDKLHVPTAVRQLSGNAHGLRIAVLEKLGVGHGRPFYYLVVQWVYAYIL
jgi:hypothetical protein